MNINYKIEFFSDWHCGSGLAAGADVDLLVIKDKNNLPYIPGKTIKGLVREAVEEINFLSKEGKTELIQEVFGYHNTNTNGKEKEDILIQGTAFFSNAELDQKQKDYILTKQLTKFLYRSIASTKIDNKGIAQDNSLRKIQTVVPCTLYGSINDIPDSLENLITNGLSFIKRLGTNRNRGLGRCLITIIK